MQKLLDFKENNKHLLFTASFLLLSLISLAQLYLLEDTIFSFLYLPFLINFFGISSVIFITWLIFITIIFFYSSISIKSKKYILITVVIPLIMIIELSSLLTFLDYNKEGIFKFSYGGALGEYIIKFPSEWDRFNPSIADYSLGFIRFLILNFLFIILFFPKKSLIKLKSFSSTFINSINAIYKEKIQVNENKKVLVEQYKEIEFDKNEKEESKIEIPLRTEISSTQTLSEPTTESHTFTPNITKNEIWNLPSDNLLQDIKSEKVNTEDINRKKELIVKTLHEHGIEVSVDQVKSGPSVTMYGLSPGYGNSKRVRVDHILAREKDLALALANQNIRFQSPMPGESLVGIEVPNQKTTVVGLKELISEANEGVINNLSLPIALGTGSDNASLYCDLTKLPHLLVAGATGSGKSVCINSIITGFLMKMSPDDIRFVMIDPKRVELTPYSGIPHLLTDPIVEPSDAIKALKLMTEEMTFRFKQLEMDNSKNISTYNEKSKAKNRVKMPYIVIVVDELADLMLNSSNEVEKLLVRLAQLGRATGIHLIVATQRPSVDVVTGLIKANFPSRISFSVTSQIDSRTIIDSPGAEKLLGKGDMLFVPIDNPLPKRAQGILISDDEIDEIVRHWRNHEIFNPVKKIDLKTIIDEINDEFTEIDSDDDLVLQAQNLARGQKTLSTSYLQRRLRIGYPRAARLMDELEERGVVGPGDSGKAREVL